MGKLISAANLLQGTAKFKELTLKQYRQLLKCFLGDDISAELIFSNTDNILKECAELTEEQIKNLNFLDYCLLLLNIRQVSIGDSIFLYTEDKEHKQLKIDLSVNRVIEQIFSKNIPNLLLPEQIDTFTVEYRIPTIEEILTLEKEKDEYSIYTFFLKSIKTTNTVIKLEQFNFKSREEIVQKIPIKVMTALTKRTHEIIKTCNEINLLKSVNSNLFDKQLILTLNSQIIAYIIKLLYNTSLEYVYECMFALSKIANMSCEFLDECSPGEFYFFVKRLEEMNAKQQEQSSTEEQTLHNTLPPITSEFGLE